MCTYGNSCVALCVHESNTGFCIGAEQCDNKVIQLCEPLLVLLHGLPMIADNAILEIVLKICFAGCH